MKKIYQSRAEQQDAYRDSLGNVYEWLEGWEERHPKQSAEVREFVRDAQRKIAEEIGYTPGFETHGWPREKYAARFPLGHHPGEETTGYVLWTLYAFRKDTSVFVREFPEGIVTAGNFPDIIGLEIVSETHRLNLEVSPTYSALYRELLSILDQRFGNNRDRNSAAIKQELAGTFVLDPEWTPSQFVTENYQRSLPTVEPVVLLSRAGVPRPEQPQFESGYETPPEEQSRLNGFGRFGMTRASHEPG
jgi:hypothetical protein